MLDYYMGLGSEIVQDWCVYRPRIKMQLLPEVPTLGYFVLVIIQPAEGVFGQTKVHTYIQVTIPKYIKCNYTTL